MEAKSTVAELRDAIALRMSAKPQRPTPRWTPASDRVRLWAESRGMDLDHLAECLGIEARRFRRIMNGTIDPTGSEVMRLADEMEWPFDSLQFMFGQQRQVAKAAA